MDTAGLEAVAAKLRERNQLDCEIAEVNGRPMTSGHLAEWIASQVFGISLNSAANQRGIDGYFTGAPLEGRSVNVKWYLKREGILDLSPSGAPDYYLVLTGPASAARSSAGTTRPWRIDFVYLFDAKELHTDLAVRGRRIGVASSVRRSTWESAEIYPTESARLPLTPQQRSALAGFAL